MHADLSGMCQAHGAVGLFDVVEKRFLERGLEAEPPRQENLEYHHAAKTRFGERQLVFTWALCLRGQIRVEVTATMKDDNGSDETVALCYIQYQGYKGQQELWTSRYNGPRNDGHGHLRKFAERHRYFPANPPIDRERWFRYLDDLLVHCLLRPPLAS